MWRLDLLEVNFHQTYPRYSNTSKLLKSKKLQKLKLPPKHKLDQEIGALKSQLFHKKYHGVVKTIHKHVKRINKNHIHKLQSSKKPDDLVLIEFLNDESFVRHLVTAKAIKLIQGIFPKQQPEYLPEEVVTILNDKGHVMNPRGFFIKYCQPNKCVNLYISNLWNLKQMKSVMLQAEWALKLVRGISFEEKEEHKRQLGKAGAKPENESDEGESESDEGESDEGESDEGESDEGESDESKESKEESEGEANKEESEDSGNEESEEESEEETGIDKKYNLPELATGYYSGSDDEVIDEKVAEIPQRRNRRGQRARQKIWEQKYGKKANHKQKEFVALDNDRKRRQLEYEQRQQKRLMKSQTGANLQPLGQRTPADSALPIPEPIGQNQRVLGQLHPSWQAKKLAEEKIRNTKFQGKKITFD